MEHTQPKPRPLAIWNPQTDRWELEQETIFGHSDAYSETWPTSGMTANGVAYELPTWEHHTADTGSSSSQPDAMLPTPLANEAEKAWVGKRESKGQKYLSHIIGEHLLPTPTTSEATGAGRSEKKTGGENLRTAVTLLPTPVAQPSGNTPENHLRKKPGRQVVTDLAILVENDMLTTGGKLLPTPTTQDVAYSSGGTYGKPLGQIARETLLPTPKAGDGAMHTPSTSGRPVEKSTHLGTIAMLQAGHLEHRRTGESTPRLFVDGKPCEEPPLPLPN